MHTIRYGVHAVTGFIRFTASRIISSLRPNGS